jgi:hypothetical protein
MAPAFGRASVAVGVLAACLLPIPNPPNFLYEGRLYAATFAGMAGAAGIGLGLAAVRVRVRPSCAAWLGLVGNLGIVVAVAVQLIMWW